MSHSEIKNGLQKFREKRTAQNEKIPSLDNLGVKRFFNVDSNTHIDGALDSKTKKLLGDNVVTMIDMQFNHYINTVEVMREQLIQDNGDLMRVFTLLQYQYLTHF